MTVLSLAHQAAAKIAGLAPDFKPCLGLACGSGQGQLAEILERPVQINYSDLPGFNDCTVQGHTGSLCLGWTHGLPVACLQGRAHFYEGVSSDVMKTMIRTLKLLGCDVFLAVNAAGSLRAEVKPGALVMITDHINFQPFHPLLGPNDEEFGPRFVEMGEVYDLKLREQLTQTAERLQIPLEKGVYISTLGPTFETPAEIRAFRTLGADVIGMSTIPEVIIARHCGLQVIVISAISNLASGLSAVPLSHETTLKGARLAETKLTQLIQGFIEDWGSHWTKLENRKSNILC